MSSKTAVVIRTRTAIDPETILKGGLHEKTEVLGKTYYKATDETQPSIYLADEKTAVLALDAGLSPLMDQDGAAIERAEFGFVDASKHIVIAVAPNDLPECRPRMIADALSGAEFPQESSANAGVDTDTVTESVEK